MMLRTASISTILLNLVAFASIHAQTPALTDSVREQTFNLVWQTVKDKHFDQTFGGLDWDEVGRRYRSKAAAAKDEAELHRLLRQMLGELGQSHFNVFAPGSVPSDDQAMRGPSGETGIELALVDGRALITRVAPDSSAARTGIRPGHILLSIDGASVESLLAKYKESEHSQTVDDFYKLREVEEQLHGRAGTSVRIAYLDAEDREQVATVTREVWRGEVSPPVGNMPPTRIEFETRRLPGDYGYIRFDIFVPSLMERIRTAIKSFADAPGIVIDLRGNPGGVGAMSSGIAGLLCREQGNLGRMQMRSGYLNFAIYPQQNPYTGPVAIIMDGRSASTSEVLASGLQELGRAVIVGERSAGAALPSIFTKLPTGAIFQYAVADFKTPKGKLIEGRGVQPDVEVKPERRALLEGRDPQLEAALTALAQKAGAGKRQ